jgi:hypothetical protein
VNRRTRREDPLARRARRPTIHLSIGAEPLSVEASRVCVLTDPADGLDVIAQHTVDALTAAHRRRTAA